MDIVKNTFVWREFWWGTLRKFLASLGHQILPDFNAAGLRKYFHVACVLYVNCGIMTNWDYKSGQ
jgi:hypothetical protein